MPLPFGVRQRRREPEIIDQPDLEEGRHVQALRGLERINRWSGSARILWPPIRALARQSGGAPLRLLDVATGGGDAHELFIVLLKERCELEGLGTPDDVLLRQFRLHLHRGISHLATPQAVRSIADLVYLATEEVEPQVKQ